VANSETRNVSVILTWAIPCHVESCTIFILKESVLQILIKSYNSRWIRTILLHCKCIIDKWYVYDTVVEWHLILEVDEISSGLFPFCHNLLMYLMQPAVLLGGVKSALLMQIYLNIFWRYISGWIKHWLFAYHLLQVHFCSHNWYTCFFLSRPVSLTLCFEIYG
jgi:hypothetical protein